MSERRSRVCKLQTKYMVHLVENHFIRHFGGCCNVNFAAIDMITWEKFENILNKLGPKKSALQWKLSFANMVSRVRNKGAIIGQSGSDPIQKLSECDRRIFNMLPKIDFEMLLDNGGKLRNANENQHDVVDAKLNKGFVICEDGRSNDANSETIYRDDIVNDEACDNHGNPDGMDYELVGCDETYGSYVNPDRMDYGLVNYDETYVTYVNPDEMDCELVGVGETSGAHANPDGIVFEELSFADFQRDNDYHSEVASSTVDHNHILIAESAEELDRYPDDPIIVEDIEDDPIIVEDIEDDPIIVGDIEDAPKSSNESALRNTAKSNPRVTESQKERLVQLIQNNFLKIVGRFTGANGVHVKTQLWQKITTELNKLGPKRTVKQWKNTFNGIKLSAKAKLADNHNDVNGTVTKSLNLLEEKIVAIYGLDSLDGDQRIGETGFNYEKTVPNKNPAGTSYTNSQRLNKPHNPQKTSTVTSGEFDSLSRNHESNNRMSSSVYEELRPTDNEVRCRQFHLPTLIGLGSDNVRPPTSEEDSVLREILSSLNDETNEGPVEERRAPSNTMRDNISTSKTVDRPFQESRLANGHNTVKTTLAKPSTISNHNSSTSGKAPAIERARDCNRCFQSNRAIVPVRDRYLNIPRTNVDDDDESLQPVRPTRDHDRARSSGRNVQVPRVRYPRAPRDDDEDEGESLQPIRPQRDRSNLRNRFTSYDMVQRSMQNQENFIEQSGRNHAEVMYTTDRNHAEMVGIFTSNLQSLADVARDYLARK